MNEEEKKAIERLKIGKHTTLNGGMSAIYSIKDIETILNLIEKQQKEIEEMKSDLNYMLEQTRGAFENNWCIDWNFTGIREKYKLGGKIEWD